MMSENKIPFETHGGDVLVHPDSVLSVLGDLCERFSIQRFLDLCVVIEAVILNERLVAPFRPDRVFVRKLDNPLAQHLMTRERIVWPISVEGHPDAVMEKRYWQRFNQIASRFGQARDFIDIKDIWHRGLPGGELLEGIFYEEVLNIPYIPTFQQLPYFMESRSVINRHNLYLEYVELLTVLKKIRVKEEGFIALPVPPIALNVLSQCENLNPLPQIVIECRERFKRLRKLRNELDLLVQDGSIPPRKKRAKRLGYQRAWKQMVRDVFGGGSENLNLVINPMESDSDLIDLAGLKTEAEVIEGFPYAKVLTGLIRLGYKTHLKFRLRPLSCALQQSFETSAKEVNDIVRRLFQHELSDDEFKLAHRMFDSVNKCLAVKSVNS